MHHTLELEFIHFVHQFRNPWLDHFFKLLNFFDRQEFFFILIPIIWLGQGWKTGLRLFYMLLLSTLTNHVLKEFFLSPRPFHLEPNVGIIWVSGLGFPSGAAQTAILLSSFLLNFWKSFWIGILAFTYIALISFSRVYLGVHFPSDILGGWFVGCLLCMLYLYAYPLIEKWFERLKPHSLFLLSQAFPLFLLVWQYSIPAICICSVAMGLGISLFINHSFQLFLPPPQDFKEYILRAIIGVLGTFICYALTLLLPSPHSFVYLFSQFLLIGLWLGLGSQLVCYPFLPTPVTQNE